MTGDRAERRQIGGVSRKLALGILLGVLLASAASFAQNKWERDLSEPPPTFITGALTISEPSSLYISNPKNGEMAVIVHSDGTVEYGKGFTAGNAAKLFWDTLAQTYGDWCPSRSQKWRQP
jgi:hypothetical protein